MIRLENVSFQYDKKTQVLNNFSMKIEEGEIIAIHAKSGFGKSTILRLIAGLESANSGNIYFDDQLMNNIPTNKRHVGYVFQNHALFPHLTVRSNIEYGLHNIASNERNELINDVSKKVNIDDLLDRYPHEISGGQQQRVAIARSLVTKPRVLLLDEPFSSLDAELKHDVRSDIKRIVKESGITCILVTHDIEDGKHIADRIVNI